jgi:hypothetical protein
MTVAMPIDAEVLPWSDLVGNEIVAVHDYGLAHSTAVCSCGWVGKRRFLKAAAEQDAWVHSMHEKCTVSVPLVIPVSRTALLPQDLVQQ